MGGIINGAPLIIASEETPTTTHDDGIAALISLPTASHIHERQVLSLAPIPLPQQRRKMIAFPGKGFSGAAVETTISQGLFYMGIVCSHARLSL